MTGTEVPNDFMFTASAGFCLETGRPKMTDIAHALGMQCRYNGSVLCFYSVAQHCCKVSRVLEDRGYDLDIQLLGLLHDAAEAYTGDITVPVQRTLDMTPIKELEKRILGRIWDVANIFVSPDQLAKVKEADCLMLRVEIRDLISDQNPHKDVHDFASLPRQYSLCRHSCMHPEDASDTWMSYYRRLQQGREEAACVT